MKKFITFLVGFLLMATSMIYSTPPKSQETLEQERALEVSREKVKEKFKALGLSDSMNIAGCTIKNADLSGLLLDSIIAIGSNFENVKFDNSNLNNANLSNAVFMNCSFYKTSLRNANCTNSKFIGGSLQESAISGINLTNALIDKNTDKRGILLIDSISSGSGSSSNTRSWPAVRLDSANDELNISLPSDILKRPYDWCCQSIEYSKKPLTFNTIANISNQTYEEYYQNLSNILSELIACIRYDFSYSNCSGKNFNGYCFRNANLAYANLEDVNLENSDFRGANLKEISLKNGKMKNMRITDKTYLLDNTLNLNEFETWIINCTDSAAKDTLNHIVKGLKK